MNVVGSRVFVGVENIDQIPAKIDTGADSSSIWASNQRVEDGELIFTLFAPGSKYYTGKEIRRKSYSTINVKNSTGDISTRYLAHLTLRLKDRKIRTRFTLADRSRNRYPILIGRRTLNKKFVVDVSRGEIPPERPRSEVKYQATKIAKTQS